MVIVEFGLIRKFLLFPFIHPFFCTFKSVFKQKFTSSINKNTNQTYLLIINLVFTHLSLLFQIIPESISRFRQKRKNLELLNPIFEDSNLIFRNYSKFNSKSFFLILLSTILYYSGYGIRSDDNFLILGRFNLLFWLSFWSFIILDFRIHSHQYIGIFFIIIGTIFLICLNIFNGINDLNLFDVILSFSSYAIFCAKFCINKFLLEIYYISPFFILLIEGICGLIIDFLITIFLIKIDYFKINEIKILINDLLLTQKNIIFLLLYILFEGMTQTCIMITIFYFNPTMVGVSDYLSVFIEGIIRKLNWTNYIGYLLIIFGIFIYNELIIFNFWNLEFHTKKYIIKRSSFDAYFSESLGRKSI